MTWWWHKFASQDGSLSTKTEAHIDGMYGYATKVLNQNIHVSSERFGDLSDSVDFVPVGQSLVSSLQSFWKRSWLICTN